MISRRDKLLIHPWELQRYENHRKKVNNAKAAIDVRSPTSYHHVTVKPKKVQAEKERLKQIEKENVRLLQKLSDIMGTKRLQNFWIQPRPNFLNREKLFENRPKTCSAIMSTTNRSESPEFQYLQFRSYKGCQSCSGRPIENVQKTVEERMPWEPTRKSWNIRDIEEYRRKICPCCHKIV